MPTITKTLALASLLFGFATLGYTEVITPSTAKGTSQFTTNNDPEGTITVNELIDGSGLDGVGPVESQMHDNDDFNMWFSGDVEAGFGPSGVDGDGDPFTVLPPADQLLEFLLPGRYDLDSALVWQYNEEFDFFGFPVARALRGVFQMEILVSPTAAGEDFTSLGVFSLATAHDHNLTIPVPPEPAQELALTGATSVRRVRFDILSNIDMDPNVVDPPSGEQFVGLSEVRFKGTIVPEASTVILVLLGVAGLLPFALWRRRRRT